MKERKNAVLLLVVMSGGFTFLHSKQVDRASATESAFSHKFCRDNDVRGLVGTRTRNEAFCRGRCRSGSKTCVQSVQANGLKSLNQ